MPQPRNKRLLTFPIDDDLRDGLERIRTEVGIPVAEQIRRGIRMWLEEQPPPGKARRAKGTARRAIPKKLSKA